MVATLLRRDAPLDGRASFKNLFKEIYAQRTAPTRFNIACRGDSVAQNVYAELIRLFRASFGDGGLVYSSTGLIGLAGTAGAPTLELSGSYTQHSGDFTYLPTGDHVTLNNAAVATFKFGETAGFSVLRAYFAKTVGGGSVLVEVVNKDTLAVIASETIDCSGTLGQVAISSLANAVTSTKCWIRCTATGTVILLTAAFLKATGVSSYDMARGSTTIVQWNTANPAIAKAILENLNTRLDVFEAKEALADVQAEIVEFAANVASVTGCDHLWIGSLPDSSDAATQRAIIDLVRSTALDNDFAFFDGYKAIGDYATATALGWNGDGTHLSQAAYSFAATSLYALMGVGFSYGGKFFGKELQKATLYGTGYHFDPDTGAATINFLTWAGGADATQIILQHIRFLYLGGAPGAVPRIGRYGDGMLMQTAAGADGPVRASNFEATTGGNAYSGGTANMTTGYNISGTTVIDSNRHIRLRSYTVATLPAATTVGAQIYVSDGTSNKRQAVSDGTNWRFPDGAVVS